MIQTLKPNAVVTNDPNDPIQDLYYTVLSGEIREKDLTLFLSRLLCIYDLKKAELINVRLLANGISISSWNEKEGWCPVEQPEDQMIEILSSAMDSNKPVALNGMISTLDQIPDDTEIFKLAIPVLSGSNGIAYFLFLEGKNALSMNKEEIAMLRLSLPFMGKQLNRTFSAIEKEDHISNISSAKYLDLNQLGVSVGRFSYSSVEDVIECSNEIFDFLDYAQKDTVKPPQFFIPFVLDIKFRDLQKEFYKETMHDKEHSRVVKYRTLKGELKYANITARRFPLDDNQYKIQGSVVDITDYKRVEIALKENESRYQKILANIQVGIITSNKNNELTMANKKFLEMFGYNAEDIKGMKITDIAPMEDARKLQSMIRRMSNGETHDFEIENHFKKKDGTVLSVLTMTFGLFDENGIFQEAISSILDISMRVESNKRIMESIIETENMERTRISTTLHDSIGQNLTSIHLILNSVRNNKSLNESDAAYIEKSIKIILQTINELREISHNLMPKHLNRFGLIASVQNLIEDINNTSGNTRFKLFNNFDDKALSINVQLAIYRIIQEAVNNILKHAKATEVNIQMIKHSQILLILIEDNGVGFDLDKASKEKSGVGLRSMENRAKSISGNLSIETSPGNGTTITIQLNT